MENYLPLFSIGVLVFMFYWMLFPIRLSKVKAWCKKAWYNVSDFFCNICERIADDIEQY